MSDAARFLDSFTTRRKDALAFRAGMGKGAICIEVLDNICVVCSSESSECRGKGWRFGADGPNTDRMTAEDQVVDV